MLPFLEKCHGRSAAAYLSAKRLARPNKREKIAAMIGADFRGDLLHPKRYRPIIGYHGLHLGHGGRSGRLAQFCLRCLVP